jgi:hypothetical protein
VNPFILSAAWQPGAFLRGSFRARGFASPPLDGFALSRMKS